MLVAFWVVVGLVGILLFQNARNVVAQYMIDQRKAKLVIYIGPLLVLGYLFLHITSRTMSLVQVAQEQSTGETEQLVAEVRQGAYVAKIFRRKH